MSRTEANNHSIMKSTNRCNSISYNKMKAPFYSKLDIDDETRSLIKYVNTMQEI